MLRSLMALSLSNYFEMNDEKLIVKTSTEKSYITNCNNMFTIINNGINLVT